VLSLVHSAFSRASIANRRAQRTELLSEAAAACHELRRESTERGAIAVEPDALFHHGDFRLSEASRRTVVTSGGARVASFDTIRELFMTHELRSLFGWSGKRLHASFQARRIRCFVKQHEKRVAASAAER
jgi:hypothetical protein